MNLVGPPGEIAQAVYRHTNVEIRVPHWFPIVDGLQISKISSVAFDQVGKLNHFDTLNIN